MNSHVPFLITFRSIRLWRKMDSCMSERAYKNGSTRPLTCVHRAQTSRWGLFVGPGMEAWVEVLQREGLMREYESKADHGDVYAMIQLAKWHKEGIFGVIPSSTTMMRHWLHRAAMAGDCLSIVACAKLYLNASPPNISDGIILLATAAGMDSEMAHYILGFAYLKGQWGIKKNDDVAEHHFLLAEASKCRGGHEMEEMRTKAALWLSSRQNQKKSDA